MRCSSQPPSAARAPIERSPDKFVKVLTGASPSQVWPAPRLAGPGEGFLPFAVTSVCWTVYTQMSEQGPEVSSFVCTFMAFSRSLTPRSKKCFLLCFWPQSSCRRSLSGQPMVRYSPCSPCMKAEKCCHSLLRNVAKPVRNAPPGRLLHASVSLFVGLRT